MNRKKSLQYDQVLQRQRDLIYATRKKLLDGASIEAGEDSRDCEGGISQTSWNHFDCIQSNKKHGRRRGRKKDDDKNNENNTEQYTSMLKQIHSRQHLLQAGC